MGPTEANRIQALVMHACDKTLEEINAVTGVKRTTFQGILNRAKERGYEPGGEVLMAHVAVGSTPNSGAAAGPSTPKKAQTKTASKAIKTASVPKVVKASVKKVTKTPTKGKGKKIVEEDSDDEDVAMLDTPAAKLEPASDDEMQDRAAFKLEPMSEEDDYDN